MPKKTTPARRVAKPQHAIGLKRPTFAKLLAISKAGETHSDTLRRLLGMKTRSRRLPDMMSVRIDESVYNELVRRGKFGQTADELLTTLLTTLRE